MIEFRENGPMVAELRYMNDRAKTETAILRVDNLKCGGCEATVRRIANQVAGVIEAEASSSEGIVRFVYEPREGLMEVMRKKLSKAGYPPQGESDFLQKAASYLSCAKGRLTS